MEINQRQLARILDQAENPIETCQQIFSTTLAVVAKHRGRQGAIETLLAYAQALAESDPASPTEP